MRSHAGVVEGGISVFFVFCFLFFVFCFLFFVFCFLRGENGIKKKQEVKIKRNE